MAFPKLSIIGGVGLLIGATFGGGYWFGRTSERLKAFDEHEAHPKTAHVENHGLYGVESVAGQPGQLRLSTGVIDSLKIRVAAARQAPATEPLLLAGSLFLDSSHLAVVHTRFSGEIVEVGQVPVTDANGAQVADSPVMRQLRAGDFVSKGQLIAIIWSKEIGEKKSDLIDFVSRRSASKATLERLEGLEKGSVSGQVVREARQKFESDVIAVERAERTLRSWRETDDEIAEVYAEAARISRGESPGGTGIRKTWANVEIRSPLDGTVLERNVSLGEIVETGVDLFRIADLSRMGVLANVYEEDIPKLTAVRPDQRTWKVRLKAEPESDPIDGRIEVIGHVIDPSQHTAAVVGWIDNPRFQLRTGQFITATIELPGPSDAVVVPNSAVIDEGSIATVFVASDASLREVRARRVAVIRRGRDLALIQCSPAKNDSPLAAEPLLKGELVVTSGNLELFGVLQDQPQVPLTETAGSR